MLRNLLLGGGVSPLVYYAAENESGTEELPLETPTETKPTETPVAAAEMPAEAVAEAPSPKPDWRDKELNKKHRQIKERDAALEAAKARETEVAAENERLRALVEAANRRAPVAGEAERPVERPVERLVDPARSSVSDDERIKAAAATLVAQQTAEQQMDAAVAKGKTDYGPKWDTSIENLRSLGGFSADTLTGILATDDPSKVFYELGRDPGDGNAPAYERIMSLPPAKRLNELAKMAMKGPPATPAKTISDAAAPVEPIVQGGTAAREKPFNLYDQTIVPGSYEKSPFEVMKMDSDANDEKWFAARTEQKKNSKGRPWSPTSR